MKHRGRNPKGGAHNTTALLMIAEDPRRDLRRQRPGLGQQRDPAAPRLARGVPTMFNAPWDPLHDIIDRLPFASEGRGLNCMVWPARCVDILASDEDPGSVALIDDRAFAEPR